MNNEFFVKIEDKTMPVCDFNYPDLDKEESHNAGFINFVYLFGFAVTAFMWVMLIFFRK